MIDARPLTEEEVEQAVAMGIPERNAREGQPMIHSAAGFIGVWWPSPGTVDAPPAEVEQP